MINSDIFSTVHDTGLVQETNSTHPSNNDKDAHYKYTHMMESGIKHMGEFKNCLDKLSEIQDNTLLNLKTVQESLLKAEGDAMKAHVKVEGLKEALSDKIECIKHKLMDESTHKGQELNLSKDSSSHNVPTGNFGINPLNSANNNMVPGLTSSPAFLTAPSMTSSSTPSLAPSMTSGLAPSMTPGLAPSMASNPAPFLTSPGMIARR